MNLWPTKISDYAADTRNFFVHQALCPRGIFPRARHSARLGTVQERSFLANTWALMPILIGPASDKKSLVRRLARRRREGRGTLGGGLFRRPRRPWRAELSGTPGRRCTCPSAELPKLSRRIGLLRRSRAQTSPVRARKCHFNESSPMDVFMVGRRPFAVIRVVQLQDHVQAGKNDAVRPSPDA